MQSNADAQENRTAELTPPVRPRAPWRVAEVEALPGFRLRVRFNDGTVGMVDMGAFVKSEVDTLARVVKAINLTAESIR